LSKIIKWFPTVISTITLIIVIFLTLSGCVSHTNYMGLYGYGITYSQKRHITVQDVYITTLILKGHHDNYRKYERRKW